VYVYARTSQSIIRSSTQEVEGTPALHPVETTPILNRPNRASAAVDAKQSKDWQPPVTRSVTQPLDVVVKPRGVFEEKEASTRCLDDITLRSSPHTKRNCIRLSMSHAWNGYYKFAWPGDELSPLSKTGFNTFGVALTAIDALDTLLIMGLDAEFETVRDWVKNGNLHFSSNSDSNVFELTIRALGGLMSAHHLSHDIDDVFLKTATQLAAAMLPAFDRKGLHFTSINFATQQGTYQNANGCIAEAGTLILEWEALEHSLKARRYAGDPHSAAQGDESRLPSWLSTVPLDVASGARFTLNRLHTLGEAYDYGLIPSAVSSEGVTAKHGLVKLGATGDSYYEYLLKHWVHSNRPPGGEVGYLRAMDGVFMHLLSRAESGGLLFLGEASHPLGPDTRLDAKMDHLVCYLPGLLSLGVAVGKIGTLWGEASPAMNRDAVQERLLALELPSNSGHLAVAEELMTTCIAMYDRMPLGLAPEIAIFAAANARVNSSSATFFGDLGVKHSDAHNLLRPETVESLFLLYRATGKQIYRDAGWRIWTKWEAHARVATGGYADINSVLSNEPDLRDKQESFFLAETLKYLFLLFTDDPSVFPLDCYVFNTEAHPLPILGIDVRDCVANSMRAVVGESS